MIKAPQPDQNLFFSTDQATSKKKMTAHQKYQAQFNLQTLPNSHIKKKDIKIWHFENKWTFMRKRGNHLYQGSLSETALFRKLTAAIKLSKTTRKLVLESSENTWQTHSGFMTFCESLKSLPCLSEIELRYNNCLNIPQGFLPQGFIPQNFFVQCFPKHALARLGEGLKRLKSLKTLKINFLNCRGITSREMSDLSETLKELLSLQNLTISCQWYSQRSFEETEAEIYLKGPPLLKNITLKFPDFEGLTNQKLLNLAQTLKGQTRLENIRLDFTGCEKITGIGVSHLMANLKEIPSLQTMNLDFSHCRGIPMMPLSYFDDPVSLKSLSLNFHNCGGFHGGNFSEILKGMTSLQKINLNFSRCHLLDGRGFQSVYEGLQRLSSLKDFTINFSHRVTALDPIIIRLSDFIQEKPILKRLKFDFECSEMRTKEFLKLCEALKMLDSPEKIVLNLLGCKEVLLSEQTKMLGELTTTFPDAEISIMAN